MHKTMERLYAAAEKKGVIGQTNVAKAMDETPQTVNNWESRGVSKNGMIKAQNIFFVDANWLATGIDGNYREDFARHPNTEPAPSIKGRVPLISWVQAGAMCAITDNFAQGEVEDWLPCPVKHSVHTYVLRVRGSSMYNPHGERSFRDGDLIFIDPERAYIHKSLVVVRLDNSNEATFKQLIIEGETLCQCGLSTP